MAKAKKLKARAKKPLTYVESLRDLAKWDAQANMVYADWLMEEGDKLHDDAMFQRGEYRAKDKTNSVGMRMNFIPAGRVLSAAVSLPARSGAASFAGGMLLVWSASAGRAAGAGAVCAGTNV